MHKNCPHVKVHALAPLGSLMFSVKGINAFEQWTWEQRPSQVMFILKPFDLYYKHQSSDKMHTVSSLLPVIYQRVNQRCSASVCPWNSGLQSNSSFPPEQDWWSIYLTLVGHNWTAISIHTRSLESGLIPSQSQWKSPLWLVAWDQTRIYLGEKKKNSDKFLFPMLVIDSTRQWQNHCNIFPKKTFFLYANLISEYIS